STGTNGSDDNDPSETTIEIQGLVSGPLSDPGKSLLSDSSSTEYNSGVSNNSTDDFIASELATSIAEKSVSGESPMPGIVVSIYELSDYISNQESASVLATTTTDSEGQYSVSEIEEGIDIVIVTGSNPRQTLIVINSEEDSSGDINSATSIVSEYWALELSNGTVFNQDEFDGLLNTAHDLLEDMSTDELLSLLTELVPENFGEGFPGNLSSDAQHFVGTLTGIDFASCEDIEFEMSSGKPTNYIQINGLSDAFGDEPLGWVYESEKMDEENRFAVYIERINETTGEMLIPIHPGNYMEGGTVTIEIYNENQSINCSGISFEIEALESAPGTIKQMIDNLEIAFKNMAQEFGYNIDELLAVDVSDLPDEVKALAASIQTLDGSNNPNSIRQILNGQAPVLEGEPLDTEVLELFDALFHESGLSEKLLSFNELFDSQAKLNSTVSLGNCLVLPENISTPGELNCWMGVQAWFENANQGLSREIRDATGAVLGIGGVAALASGAGAPLIAPLGISATAVTMMQIFIDANDNTLPSQLLGFEILGNPEIYNNEDDNTVGEWSAELAAESNGWTLDWVTTLENVPGLGKVSGIFNKTNMPNAIEFLIDNFQREANNIWKADSGPISLSPQIQQVTIDINRDEDFFNWELNTKSQETNTDPFSFTQDERGYTPEAVGTADLRVETKGGDVFKGQKVFNILELEVEPINVTIGTWIGENIFTGNESPYYINVQEELSLYADVSNAINKEVIWSVNPQESGLSVLDLAGRDNVVEVLATESGSYIVEAESIADTGPRADKTPRRFDQVRIVVGGLNVSNPGCVETGSTYQLTASIGGETVDFSELKWDINGPGSIDSDGVYSAGSTGDVQIQFKVIDQPQTTDTISFSVSEMCSSFTISSPKFNFSGTCVGYEELEGTNRTAIYFDPQHEQPNGQIIIKEILSEVMSTTESWTETDPGWSINSFVQSGLEWPSKTWGYAPDDNIGAGGNFTLNHEVREYDETNVRVLGGSFSAEFRWDEVVGEEIIERLDPVTIDFTGALPPGERRTNHECLATGGS
ncbi:MAG: hypothetical protein GVY20_08925, partial [Bacteroidetes bacterium]|nr:hypothetical protein [Bacteroidota bacterium]